MNLLAFLSNPLLIEAAGVFVLGVLTTIQPCPLTTNFAALTLMFDCLQSSSRKFAVGLAFLFGIIFSYVLLGFLICYGVISVPLLANFLQETLGKLQGPLLIIIGMFFVKLLKLPKPMLRLLSGKHWKQKKEWGIGAGFILGAGLVLSFCPTTAAMFFGIMIPIASTHEVWMVFPVLYGLGAGIPIAGVALLASRKTRWLEGKGWDRWRRLLGITLIVAGIFWSLKNIYGAF